MMPMATFRWASHATATGSVRADTLGCSVALPCWCLTADRWDVSYHPPRTVRCLQHSHPHLRRWSKKGSRTSPTHYPDPICPQELYLFLSGTGPGTNQILETEVRLLLCHFEQSINAVHKGWVKATNGAHAIWNRLKMCSSLCNYTH